MLRARILVALFGVPLGVVLVVLGGPAFALGLGLMAILGLHEFYTLTRPYRPNLLVGYLAALGILAGTYFAGFAGLFGGFTALLGLLFFWGMGGRLGHHLVGRMAVTALGVVWIAVGFAYVVLLRGLEHGLALTVLVVGGTWVNDTFAFFVGRAFGRRRMAPRISPKKTVEGALAGIVGALLFALGVKMYSPWLRWRDAAVLGVVVGVVGQWGDLFESAVKRDLQVKNSGRLFPGHGGVLDRFDSVLFAGMAAYWGAVLVLKETVGGLLP
ncbi:MAG: phosphatidate cytidylyltransferase [Thermoleophilia bacterium]